MDPYSVLKGVIELFVVVDPIGNVPALLAVTSELRPRDRVRVVHRAVAFAAVLILGFAVAGKATLDYLGISVEALMIAGGILLLRASFGMVEGDPTGFRIEPESRIDVAYVPLGTPLLAGPGAIVTVIIMLHRHGRLETMLACLIVMLFTLVIFRAAERLARFLGRSGIRVLTRVMGVLLAAIGVQMVLDGVSAFVRG
ncbi:MarC family protein [Methanopyrus sp. KOL6]|uniref:MarC family protein n=1 Tax=Methanopyrus sp. KOL6 TaxID=1937004 RepID=UPI0012FCB858|nr:MarC family protein [Methanopyrus sp. KOL6]